MLIANGAKFSVRVGTSDEAVITDKNGDTKRTLKLVKPGDIWLDLGAYIGTFCIPALLKGVRVIAYEPNPESRKALLANLKLNDLTCEVFPEAVVAKTFGPMITLNFTEKNSARCSSGRKWKRNNLEISVPTISFREALSRTDKMACVKMNIEGAEIEILEAIDTSLNLRRCVFNYHFDVDPKIKRLEAILEHLKTQNYTVQKPTKLPDHETWKWFPASIWGWFERAN